MLDLVDGKQDLLRREILGKILRPAGAKLVLWGDNPHLNKPAGACRNHGCYMSDTHVSQDAKIVEFAKKHDDVFAYSQLDLWKNSAHGGNGYVPGTNAMGFQDSNHLSYSGSVYVGAYICAAFNDWGLI